MTSGGVEKDGARLVQSSDDAASARTERIGDVHKDNPDFDPLLLIFLINTKTISPFFLSLPAPAGTGAPHCVFRELLCSFILGDGLLGPKDAVTAAKGSWRTQSGPPSL